MNKTMTTLVVITGLFFTLLTLGLTVRVSNLQSTLTEMNERQRDVVVKQHKSIEDMIRDVCGKPR
jgi:hypothetical protein